MLSVAAHSPDGVEWVGPVQRARDHVPELLGVMPAGFCVILLFESIWAQVCQMEKTLEAPPLLIPSRHCRRGSHQTLSHLGDHPSSLPANLESSAQLRISLLFGHSKALSQRVTAVSRSLSQPSGAACRWPSLLQESPWFLNILLFQLGPSPVFLFF